MLTYLPKTIMHTTNVWVFFVTSEAMHSFQMTNM